MTGFKPQTSGIGSDRSATTTTAWVNFLNQISCNNDLVPSLQSLSNRSDRLLLFVGVVSNDDRIFAENCLCLVLLSRDGLTWAIPGLFCGLFIQSIGIMFQQ